MSYIISKKSFEAKEHINNYGRHRRSLCSTAVVFDPKHSDIIKDQKWRTRQLTQKTISTKLCKGTKRETRNPFPLGENKSTDTRIFKIFITVGSLEKFWFLFIFLILYFSIIKNWQLKTGLYTFYVYFMCPVIYWWPIQGLILDWSPYLFWFPLIMLKWKYTVKVWKQMDVDGCLGNYK